MNSKKSAKKKAEKQKKSFQEDKCPEIRSTLFHKYTKVRWWLGGDWVNEEDQVSFIYRGYECVVARVALTQQISPKSLHIVFGGFLVGLVKIPCHHPYFKVESSKISIQCHGGITFNEFIRGHWIGFDCGHETDLIPSDGKFNNRYHICLNPQLKEKTYKTLDFCILECKSVVNQLVFFENTKERRIDPATVKHEQF